MSGTMWFSKSRLLVSLVIVVFVLSGFPARLSGRAYSTIADPPATASGTAFVMQASTPSYDLLLQDDSSGDMLRWNSTTGEYRYSRCTDGFTLTGTGTVTTHGSTYTLTHNPFDRRVQATLDNSTHSGTASIQYPLGSSTYTIADKSSTPDPGATDTALPQVGVTAPNGGEIVDTRSSFAISWNSADDVGVASHDVFYSTDGGNTYATIVTGLPGNVNQYAWSVPLMVNNKTVRVRVVARDAACNASRDDSNANFTIWNPPASFTHQAEAPLFMSGQGLTSTIYLTNTSANAVVVELDPHQPNGNATQNFPYQVLLNAGASTTVDVASLYTIGASPENPAFPDLIEGGIRLRHNGAKDNDVRAIIVAEQGCSEQFTTPFTYAASSLSATGTMQCSPMYYVDEDTDDFVAFQNVTNSPQTAQLTCHYGTGASGTPNGEFKNQPITLGPQQTTIVNLRSVWGQFGGAEWGSMDVFTSAPRSIVCHSVMRSAEKGIAWDCPFVDPAMSVNTTKVAQTVKLDYNNSENAYLMVRNMSATNSRTVTASFNTSNGITLPSVQVTVAPGAQQMITLDARQILKPGISTVADVRLTYAGSPSDIAAAGCSMSATTGRAVAMKFKEASVNDGRRLTSPYFRFDEDVSGVVLVSNLGTSSIKVGARMVFANSTAKPVKTAAVTIPAGGVAEIDLSSVGDAVPDNVIATGRIDLIHSGPAGTVTAAVTESGCYNSSQVVPLDGGVPLDPLALFPIAAVISPGTCTELDAITDGTVINPSFSNPSGCYGTLIGTFANGPNTFHATLCVPTNCVGDLPIVYTPPGGGGGEGGVGDESTLILVQTKAAGFSTGALGKRVNPNGTTQFTLTANDPLPNARLQVEFVSPNGESVFTQVQGDGVNPSITGTGPVNHVFLGTVKNIKVTQLNADGTPNTAVPRVLKAKKLGAYFALDKPTSITMLTPNAVPVSGGTVAITGAGFQTWSLGTFPNEVTVNPTVLIGKPANHDQIPFTVITTTQDGITIRGNVGPTPPTIGTCAEVGRTPCKIITVINPGGSDGVDDFPSQELLTINAPPPPVITGTASLLVTGATGPATSNSIGASGVKVNSNGLSVPLPVTARIFGNNLGRVESVTFVGSMPIAIGPSNIKSNREIEVGVPASCTLGGIAVQVYDGVNAPVSFGNGWLYTATGPVSVVAPGFPLSAIAYVVGPCETVSTTYVVFTDGSLQAGSCTSGIPACLKLSSFGQCPNLIPNALKQAFPNATIALYCWNYSCAACTTTSTGYFSVTAQNNQAPSNTVTTCLSSTCVGH